MVWKDVVGYEGIYQVSENGIIYSIRFGKTLSTKTNNRQYVQVHLYRDSKCSMRLVHRIVAEAFIPNDNALPQINHKDEDKNNNHYSNLEWCTNIYNRHHGTGYARSCAGHNYKEMGFRNGRPVMMFAPDGEHIATFTSVLNAQKIVGICEGSIRRVCYGKQPAAGGYRWQYCEKDSAERVKEKARKVIVLNHKRFPVPMQGRLIV